MISFWLVVGVMMVVDMKRCFTQLFEEIRAMRSKQLRDVDIKQLVDQYLTGTRFPLELIEHVIQEKWALVTLSSARFI